MSSCLIMERMGQNQRRHMFRLVRQVAALGAKSAVSALVEKIETLLEPSKDLVPSCRC